MFNSNDKVNVSDPNVPSLMNSRTSNRRQFGRKDSQHSMHSELSNKSERQIILNRAKKQLIEKRLKNNIDSLKQIRSVSNSRARSIKSEYQMQRQDKKLERSHSSFNLGVTKSRAQLLENIAGKLSKGREDSMAYSNGNKNLKSTKLDYLLKNIKKFNKQTSRVVYTIQKTKQSKNHKQSSLVPYQVRKLAQQLREVRAELHQSKQQNKELLLLAKSNSNHKYEETKRNFDNRFQAAINYPDGSFEVFSPCMACGCTCRSKKY